MKAWTCRDKRQGFTPTVRALHRGPQNIPNLPHIKMHTVTRCDEQNIWNFLMILSSSKTFFTQSNRNLSSPRKQSLPRRAIRTKNLPSPGN